MVVSADVIAPRDRGRYQPYMTTTFAVGAASGPAIGGFVAQYFTWAGIFWLCAGLGLVSLALSLVALRRLPRHERRQRLDLVGAGLLIAASATLLAAISGGLSDAVRVTLGAASALAWSGLVWWLARTPEPLIPIHILRSPLVLSGTLAAMFGAGALIVLTTFLPGYFQRVHGLSISQTGLALIPMLVGSAVGSVIAGQTMVRHPRYRRVGEVMLLISAGATVLLAVFARDLSLWRVEAVLILASLGSGAITPVTTFSIQNAIDLHELGIATSTNNFVRQLGTAIMVAVVALLIPAAETVEQTADYAPLFWAMAIAFVLGWLALLCMEERPLRGEDQGP